MNSAFVFLVINLLTNSEHKPLPITPSFFPPQVELITKKGSKPETKRVKHRLSECEKNSLQETL